MRHNKKVKPRRPDKINRAGGQAFSQTAELALASWLVTSFCNPKAYETTSDQFSRVRDLVHAVDPLFAAKAAIFARRHFGMRSSSHVVAGHVADVAAGTQWGKDFFREIVFRLDDMAEIFAYRMSLYGKEGKAMTNAMKKGFRAAIEDADAYQMSKYKMNTRSVKLVDIINLVHPNSEIARALVLGTLEPPYTWEVGLSQAGNDQAAKARVWHGLISDGRLGYMALVRNIRNIVSQADDSTIRLALKQLTDKKRIRGSLILPFQIEKSYRALKIAGASNRVLNAIQDAIDISVSNVPDIGDNALIAFDASGSMTATAIGSNKGKGASNWSLRNDPKVTTCADMATFFASVLARRSGADIMKFEGDAKYMKVNTRDSTMTVAGSLRRHVRGGSTNFSAVFDRANKSYDRIIFLSDMQGWVGGSTPRAAYTRYKNRFDCNPHVYLFDLAGYGDAQFHERQVASLAGFHPKVFDVLKALETDRSAFVRMINDVEF